MVMYVWFEFGYYLWIFNGKICVTTRNPQICWTVGGRMENGLHKANDTGWNKAEDLDFWYKPVFS